MDQYSITGQWFLSQSLNPRLFLVSGIYKDIYCLDGVYMYLYKHPQIRGKKYTDYTILKVDGGLEHGVTLFG